MASMSESTSTLYRGGPVHEMDGATTAADALLVRDGRVAAVGRESDVRAAAGPRYETVDLRGATLMPGFVDTHPHLFHFGALAYPLVDLSDARDFDDIVERIKRKAAATPKGQWVMTTPVGEPHYFIRRSWHDLREGVLPDRHVLDRATTDHPVYLQAWGPRTPNDCVFNTAALAALGLVRDHPDRKGNVWLEKDAHGEPTGRLHGSVNTYYTGEPYMDALLRNVPLLDGEAAVAGTRKAMGEYNRMGVTTVYEGHVMGLGEIGVYQMLRAENALTVRCLTALESENYAMAWDQPLSNEQFVANLEQAKAMHAVDDAYLRHDGVTLSRGGPLWPGFLRMHEPYEDPYGNATTGVTFVSEEKEKIALRWCAEHDLRLNYIGAGYRDHDEFLANAEAVDRELPIEGRHWILQHNYLCTEEHARRYAALGFEITTSMSFAWAKGDLMEKRIGRHVWSDLIPLRRLLDAGLLVACGSDWGPKNVFEHIALAETHEFCGSGRRNDTPGHAVTREEAILMWTRDAARVLRWDGIGTLGVGNQADMIVVDRDPLTCELERLPAAKVLRTLLGGRAVYDAGQL
jgi:predicted amidohydrolase YtcJ